MKSVLELENEIEQMRFQYIKDYVGENYAAFGITAEDVDLETALGLYEVLVYKAKAKADLGLPERKGESRA